MNQSPPPLTGFRAADVSSSFISNVNKDAVQRLSPNPDDQPGSALLARTNDLPRVAAGDFDPKLSTAPTMARIVAPSIVGDAQVVWAYAQKMRANEDGRSEVVIRDGYAPLAAANAFHVADRKNDLLGGGTALLFTIGVLSSAITLLAFFTSKELAGEVRDLKRRLEAQRAKNIAPQPIPTTRDDPGHWVLGHSLVDNRAAPTSEHCALFLLWLKQKRQTLGVFSFPSIQPRSKRRAGLANCWFCFCLC